MTIKKSREKFRTKEPVVTQNPIIESPAQEVEIGLKTGGQRRINIIWEITQAFVAVSVTMATLWVSSSLALRDEKQVAAFLLLSNAFFLVIGFYFGRTNHQRQGGVGSKEGDER